MKDGDSKQVGPIELPKDGHFSLGESSQFEVLNEAHRIELKRARNEPLESWEVTFPVRRLTLKLWRNPG